MSHEIPQALLIAALLSGTALLIAILSFVAVVVWLQHRRRERESYYQSENVKRLTEAQGADAAVAFIRETDRIQARQAQRNARGGGVVITFFSLGLLIVLWATRSPYPYDGPTYLVGIVPLFIGLGLLISGFFLRHGLD